MNENTTQRLPQNIARIIKKIKKLKELKKLKINDPPRSSWPDGWLGGRLPGWLSASKGILKESYTNPYEIQPAIRILKESYTIRTDSRLPTGLASLAASLAGVGGVVFIFNFLNFFNFFN